MTLPTRSIKSTSTCLVHKELKTYKIEGVGGRDVPDFRKIDFFHTRFYPDKTSKFATKYGERQCGARVAPL